MTPLKEKSLYSRVKRRLFNDERVRALTPPPPGGQALFIRLLIGPELTNVPGLIPIGEAALAEALGWPIRGFREAWAEVEGQALAKADWRARLVWVPNAIKHNPPASTNVVLGWQHTIDLAPECALKAEALSTLEAALLRRGEAWGEAFRKASGKPLPKPLPKPFAKASPKALPMPSPKEIVMTSANQEQEQDRFAQEQEQDGDIPQASTRALLARAFQRRWEAAAQAAWPGPKQDPDWDRVPPWLERTSALRSTTVEALIELVLEHWFADAWVIDQGYPTRHFAKHFESYLEPKSARRGSRERLPTEATRYVEDLGEFGEGGPHA